jgi:hypothetical protein
MPLDLWPGLEPANLDGNRADASFVILFRVVAFWHARQVKLRTRMELKYIDSFTRPTASSVTSPMPATNRLARSPGLAETIVVAGAGSLKALETARMAVLARVGAGGIAAVDSPDQLRTAEAERNIRGLTYDFVAAAGEIRRDAV